MLFDASITVSIIDDLIPSVLSGVSKWGKAHSTGLFRVVSLVVSVGLPDEREFDDPNMAGEKFANCGSAYRSVSKLVVAIRGFPLWSP